MDDRISRILIIKPSALGDIVHGLPVLHGLRAAHPAAHIAWMVRPAYADVLRGHPELDEIIEFDRRRFGRIGRAWAPTRDFAAWLRRLAQAKFDVALDLQGLFRSGFFALASRARLRIGPAEAREFGWVFYNQRVKAPDGAVHAVDRNYRFAEPLGFGRIPPRFDLPIGEPARQAARSRLAGAGLDPDQSYAVLAPGSTWASKRWPADCFARLADGLTERSIRSVLIGTGAEAAVAAMVRSACAPGAKPVDLAGQTGLKELIALIERAAVVVSNDSGPMHLAAALGRPLVAIFGPTDPARTGPYGRGESVVRAEAQASHRFRHDDDSAISAVSVEMARAVLEQELARGPSARLWDPNVMLMIRYRNRHIILQKPG